MEKMKIGGEKKHSHNKSEGTKVYLAGEIVYLPNDEVPVVTQILTKTQIDAIPRDEYNVKIVRKAKYYEDNRYVNVKCRRIEHDNTRLRRLLRMTGLTRKSLPDHRSRKNIFDRDGTKRYITIITKLTEVLRDVNGLYDENRKLGRSSDGDPEGGNLFFAPIDEGRMSDLIMKAVVHFFGSSAKGKICGKEYKLAVFCVLMHYYFLRVKIMENSERKAFCEYLLEKALQSYGEKFTVKTFNNYAKDYENKGFTSTEQLKINFLTRPDSSSQRLEDAFHEVGHFFHVSDYFKELKEIRKNMNGFQI